MQIDEAIRILEGIRGYQSEGFYKDAVSAGIAALHEIGKNRWIPCKERLPEQDREVLLCIYGSDLIMAQEGETLAEAVERTRREIVRVTVGFIGSDGWYGADWFPMMVAPTYWMPLPEPPKTKED